MPEHYRKGTISAPVWCNKCYKITDHSVLDGRRGSCLICLKKLNDAAEARKKVPPQPKQGDLFS